MNKKYFKIAFIIILAILFVCDTASFAQNINNANQKYKYFFKYNVDKDKNLKKYVDLAWDKYYKKELPKDLIKKLNISTKDIGIIVVDLNGDSEKDIITTTHGIPYFCGNAGAECSVVIFISDNKNYYKIVYVSMNAINDLPIYVFNSKTNGLKDIMVNKKYLLKFNKEVYQ